MAISPCTVQSCYNTTTKTRGTAGGIYGYKGQGLAPHKEAYNPMPIHMSDGLCEASSGFIWFFPCVQPHFTSGRKYHVYLTSQWQMPDSKVPTIPFDICNAQSWLWKLLLSY